MANPKWIGDALAVAQVSTISVTGTWATADTATLTINGKSLIVTIGAVVTTAGVAAAIVAAWNGDDLVGTESRNTTGDQIPEFNEITATLDGSDIVLTGDVAGTPFTVTVTETTAGDGELDDPVETVAPTGPNHWDNAENWDTGSVPVNSDNVYIENSNIDILYGLNQSGVTVTTLNISQSYTGKIGPLDRNPLGYAEYREKYLRIGAATINIGSGLGNGSPRLKLNTGTVQTAINVANSGQSEEEGLEPIRWIGTHASNTLNMTRGRMGVAVYGAEVATLSIINVGYEGAVEGDVSLRLGAGCTLTTINQNGGNLEVNSGFTTMTKLAGTTTINAGSITTLTVEAGDTFYKGVGTITNLFVGLVGVVDFSRDLRARTVTNAQINGGAKLLDPFRTVTFTNGVDLYRTNLDKVTLDLGTHITVTPSNI